MACITRRCWAQRVWVLRYASPYSRKIAANAQGPAPATAHPGRRLSAAVFPYFENAASNARSRTTNPLVRQTLRHCLGEIERGETRVIARDLTEPSPLISKDVEA
jgi:hypothetical protein